MYINGKFFLIMLYNRYLKPNFVMVVVVTNTPLSFGEDQTLVIEKFKFDSFPIICSYNVFACLFIHLESFKLLGIFHEFRIFLKLNACVYAY